MLILAALLGFGVVAVLVPYVVVKHLGVGIEKRARRDDGAIGLSFDDGPDPIATPRILEILARAGVRATFFVIGEAADAHPELVRRLVAEGHEVASHGYRHRHALFQRAPLEGYVDTRRLKVMSTRAAGSRASRRSSAARAGFAARSAATRGPCSPRRGARASRR